MEMGGNSDYLVGMKGGRWWRRARVPLSPRVHPPLRSEVLIGRRDVALELEANSRQRTPGSRLEARGWHAPA